MNAGTYIPQKIRKEKYIKTICKETGHKKRFARNKSEVVV
jgi:hypothetical protein